MSDKHSASTCWMAMTTTHGWSKWVLSLYGRHVLPSKMMWSVVCRQLIGMKIAFSWYSDVIYWILLNYIHVCLPYSVMFWFPYISLICRSQVSLIHSTLSTHCGPQRDDFKEKNYGSLGSSRIPLFLASWIWLKIIQNLCYYRSNQKKKPVVLSWFSHDKKRGLLWLITTNKRKS